MRFYWKHGIAVILSAILAITVCTVPPALASEPTEFAVEDNSAAVTEVSSEDENWLAVSIEVIEYYSKYSAGLEPLVTEKNWRFYDVIADKTINLDDVGYFMDLYSLKGAGIQYDGYIPERNGEYSPLVPSETTTETTTTTTTATTSVTETTDTAISTGTTVTTQSTSNVLGTTTVTTTATKVPTTTTNTTTTTAVEFTDDKAGEYIVDATALNMRTGPGTEYSIITSIVGGETVNVKAVGSNYWALVEYKNYVGYCAMDYLVMRNDTTTTTSVSKTGTGDTSTETSKTTETTVTGTTLTAENSSTWSASTKQTTTTYGTTASSVGPTVPATTKTTTEVSGVTNVTETTTVTTTTVITRTPHAWGIDVSVYQGNVDWAEVKESGVNFAIIRAGYGKHINQEDKYFDVNMQRAQAEGINCGAYWFSYATTPEAAVQEADVFYEVIKDYKFEYPVFFDYETNAQYELSPEESSEIIYAFCQRMESYGYYVALCSYVNFLNTRIEPEIFDCFDTWIAHYDVQIPSYKRNYGIWQYSCTGTVPGIDAPVDLNYSYFDYPAIMKNNGLNGY